MMDPEEEKLERKGLRERRAYVVLAVISIMLSASVLLLSFNAVHQSNHKFCDLFTALTASQPAPKPANPKTDPSRARSYTIYVKFLNLQRSLGCD